MARKKKIKEINFINDYLEWAKENAQNLTTEMIEEGIKEANKKQKEFDSIGVSETRLAPNILLEFKYTDEDKIKENILKVKRELGLLQDDQYKKMLEGYSSYQLKKYHELRNDIFEKGKEYHVTFDKKIICASIGRPNLDVIAEFIDKQMQESGLGNLKAETKTSVFFNQFK